MPGIEESHAARRRERINTMVRTLPKMGPRPAARAKPVITPEQRAALERASLVRAEEETPPPATLPAGVKAAALAERQAGAPERGEVWVHGHFGPEPIVAGKRTFLQLRPELTTPGSAWERFAGDVFERMDGEGHPVYTDPSSCYLSLGQDPARPGYELLVRLQRYGAGMVDRLLGGHRRTAKPGRLLDALSGVGLLAGTPDRMTSVGVVAGRPAIRGEGIVRAFTAKGYGIRPAGDRLLVELPGGHDVAGILPLLAIPRARDLVHGWASGEPLACEHPDHPGDPAPGVTVAAADVIVCAECVR